VNDKLVPSTDASDDHSDKGDSSDEGNSSDEGEGSDKREGRAGGRSCDKILVYCAFPSSYIQLVKVCTYFLYQVP
jgi:hypothetical protein